MPKADIIKKPVYRASLKTRLEKGYYAGQPLTPDLRNLIKRVCEAVPETIASSTTISEPLGKGIKSGFVLAFPNGLGLHLEPKQLMMINAHASYAAEPCNVLLGRYNDRYASLSYNVADLTFYENLEAICQARMRDLHENTPTLHNVRS